MTTRTFSLTNTLVAPSGAPLANLQVPITLLVPGGVGATDTDGNAVIPDMVYAVTDGAGTYAIDLIYPGDISPAGCQYQIVEGSLTTLSPIDFAYESSWSPTAWYGSGGVTGQLLCRINVVEANDTPVTGRYVHILPAQNAVDPNSDLLSTFTSTDALLAANGQATFWLWPSSALTPTTTYILRIDGETTRISFSVPTTPTGYQGSYVSGTTYHVNGGINDADSPADVVLYNGLYYSCIADSTGNLPTDTSYFAPFIGEPILWDATPFGTAASVPIPSTGVGHTSTVLPLVGAPVTTPASLADDLTDLQYATLHAPMAELYAADNCI
jgi:hypothetical protein